MTADLLLMSKVIATAAFGGVVNNHIKIIYKSKGNKTRLTK
jgi:hypothetical protein